MKIKTLLFFTVYCASVSNSQTILFVDDNDYITENTDSMLLALDETDHATNYDLYNIATEGSNPSLATLEMYDLVIWYTSSDGVGLGLWEDGPNGPTDLVNYLEADGKVWIIGADLLYAGGYNPPQTFVSGTFVYDYMGIESYNAQSYGDDGNLGVSELNSTGIFPDFQDSLSWIFPTAWWVDGVTSRLGAIDVYEMGPASYVLNGQVSMTHYDIDAGNTTNVMASFFDPAIIVSRVDLTAFIETAVIQTVYNGLLSIDDKLDTSIKLYPNPVHEKLIVESNETGEFTIYDQIGRIVQTGLVSLGKTIVSTEFMETGVYNVRINDVMIQFSKF